MRIWRVARSFILAQVPDDLHVPFSPIRVVLTETPLVHDGAVSVRGPRWLILTVYGLPDTTAEIPEIQSRRRKGARVFTGFGRLFDLSSTVGPGQPLSSFRKPPAHPVYFPAPRPSPARAFLYPADFKGLGDCDIHL